MAARPPARLAPHTTTERTRDAPNVKDRTRHLWLSLCLVSGAPTAGGCGKTSHGLQERTAISCLSRILSPSTDTFGCDDLTNLKNSDVLAIVQWTNERMEERKKEKH